jgi:tetratricopeptide (TPR) repeat protein
MVRGLIFWLDLTVKVAIGVITVSRCAPAEFQIHSGVISMKIVRFPLGAVCFSLALAVVAGSPAIADFDPPVKKKVDCTKPENKNKPACKPSHTASDDEIYNAGYWMARSGKYAEALAVFRKAGDQNDPRILTGIGFATRKLGNVEAAFVYYDRALARDPGLVLTRAYLGQAHLMKDDLAAAEIQLHEIERRCGASCEAYAQLAAHIAAYKSNYARKG